MVVFEYLPPLCVRVCVCAFVCVHAYTFLWHCVNFHTHTVQYTQHTWNGECPEREREREEWKQRQQRPQHTIHTGKTTCVVATEVLPYLSLFLPLSTSFALSHFLSYRVACEFLRVFGYSFWFCFPSHTHTHTCTHLHINMYECVQRLCFCVCHFVDCLCWLCSAFSCP